jgi:hypothetical protein
MVSWAKINRASNFYPPIHYASCRVAKIRHDF